MLMQSRDYLFPVAASARGYAISNPLTDGPFPDRYWIVRYCTIWDSSSTAVPFCLYLLTPAAYTQVLQAIASAGGAGYKVDFPAAGAAATPPIAGIHKLAPGSGQNIGVWNTTAVQNGNFGTIFNNTSYPDILIPGGYALYAMDASGTPPATASQILMRLAYQEILNGCTPDSAW